MRLSHYWHVPPKPRVLRVAAPLLVACVLALVAMPATAATSTAQRAAAPPATGHGAHLNLHGDTAQANSASRRAKRAKYAWTGRKILYTESLPAKWDWSLNTAIAKWNTSGGGIRFVRTAKVRKARLNIAYGNIGSAAGMASVGRSRHAWVRLSSTYSPANSLDARTRVQVMEILAHELGHVLGFQHTSTRCSLMSPVLDVDGCHMVPASMPGFYKCRTIDTPLAVRFVRLYGGRARFPTVWCPIDPIPSAVGRVDFAGGPTAPVTVRWARPASVPAGSRMMIRSWTAPVCGAAPSWSAKAYAPVSAGRWQDPLGETNGSTCYSVQLVNRYDAGRAAVSRLIA